MPRRYSSACTTYIHIEDDGGLSSPATYRVNIAVDGRNVWTGTVRGAPSDRRPIDAPEVYDEVVRAGMAFADHEGADLPCYSDAYGYVIFRRKVGGHPCK